MFYKVINLGLISEERLTSHVSYNNMHQFNVYFLWLQFTICRLSSSITSFLRQLKCGTIVIDLSRWLNLDNLVKSFFYQIHWVCPASPPPLEGCTKRLTQQHNPKKPKPTPVRRGKFLKKLWCCVGKGVFKDNFISSNELIMLIGYRFER